MNGMPTYEIALCGTEEEYTDKAKETIEKYLDDVSERFKLFIYNKPKELLSDIKDKRISPIMLYIDVELEHSSGIRVVKEVNKLAKECQIIYLSKHLKCVTELYSTKHFYFVKKGELKERLPNIFEKYDNEIKNNFDYLGIPLKNCKYAFVNVKDIEFFERQGRYTTVYTKDEIYQTKLTLNTIEERLDKDQFIRCHNSYIVALKSIKEYQRDRITIGTDKIPISRQYQVSTREKFQKYVKTYNT